MRVKRTDLVNILLEAVQHAGIPIRFNKRLTDIEEEEEEDESVRVTFEDGSTDSASMLFGCDGIHSFVRRTYLDPQKTLEYSGLSGLGSLVPTSALSPTATAQVTGLHANLTENGMFAVNPCTAAKDELFCFFSKEVAPPESDDNRDGWEMHKKGEVDGFKSTMLENLEPTKGEWGTTLREVVNSISTVNFYPVYRLRPGGIWHKGRCLLVGDAAHAMSPHAGQGVSMALEDVFLLSRLLEDPQRPLRTVFDIYDRIRRRITEIFKLAAENARLRNKTGPWGLWLKELQLSVVMILTWVLGADKEDYDSVIWYMISIKKSLSRLASLAYAKEVSLPGKEELWLRQIVWFASFDRILTWEIFCPPLLTQRTKVSKSRIRELLVENTSVGLAPSVATNEATRCGDS